MSRPAKKQRARPSAAAAKSRAKAGKKPARKSAALRATADVKAVRAKPAKRRARKPAPTINSPFLDMLTLASEHLAMCWQHLLADDTADAAHKFRVAVRRLRVVLDILRREDEQRFNDVRQSLAAVSRTAGRLRDLDVLTDEIIAPLLDADAPPGGPELVAQLTADRAKARVSVCAALDTPDMQHLRDQLHALPQRLKNRQGKKNPRRVLRKLARRDLKKRWRHFTRRAGHLADLPPDELHEARKSLKSLRYALAHFAPVLDPVDVARFHKRILQLLDLFGYLNDVEAAKVLAGRLDPQAAQRPVNCAIGYVFGTHTERARRARKKLGSRLKQLAATKMARQLASKRPSTD